MQHKELILLVFTGISKERMHGFRGIALAGQDGHIVPLGETVRLQDWPDRPLLHIENLVIAPRGKYIGRDDGVIQDNLCVRMWLMQDPPGLGIDSREWGLLPLVGWQQRMGKIPGLEFAGGMLLDAVTDGIIEIALTHAVRPPFASS